MVNVWGNLKFECCLISGSNTTFISTCYAYISDVAAPCIRTFRFACLKALIEGSSSLIYIMVGMLVEEVGFKLPFLLIMVFTMVNLLYIVMLVPEPRTDGKDSHLKEVFVNMVRSTTVYTRPREDDSNGRLKRLLLLGAMLLIASSYLGRIPLETLYLTASPFYFTPSLLGTLLGARGLLCLLFVIITVYIRQGYLSDHVIAIMSLMSSVASNLCLAFATDKLLVFICKYHIVCVIVIQDCNDNKTQF